MRALVTGATGFVGGALVRRLAGRIGEVRVAVRPGRAWPSTTPLDGVTPTSVDFSDPTTLRRALEGVEVVFHLAARLRGAPADIVADTVVASERLLDAARNLRRPPRVVLLGSYGVYQTSRSEPLALDESFPVEAHPERRDPYSLGKWLQERAAWARHREGRLDLVVVRAGTIWGPGRSPLGPRVGFAVGGRWLLFGGENLVPLCHVDGVAEGLMLAAMRGSSGSVYNLVDAAPPTARELADLARERLGLEVHTVPPPWVVRGARLLEQVAAASQGQVPAPLTEYRARSLYTPHTYEAERLRALGWTRGPTERAALAGAMT